MAGGKFPSKVVTRDKRIQRVLRAISATTPRKIGEVATRAGFSEELTRSTIRLINRSTVEEEIGEALTYVPGKGWKKAQQWDQDKDAYVRWLHRHLSTRAETELRHVEVAIALFGDQVPAELAFRLRKVQEDLDACTALLPTPQPRNPQRVDRGIKLTTGE
jgi:hypothetical protein